MRRTSHAKSPLLVATCFVFVVLISFVMLQGVTRPAEANTAALAPTYVYVGSSLNHNWGINYDGYVTGFAVAADGSAQVISGSPFKGPSYNLVSIGDYLFGDDGRDIVTYTRAANGSLKATSMVNDLALITDPGDQFIYALNPDRSGQTFNSVVSCGSCNSEILTWAIGADGKLTYVEDPAPSSSFAKWNGIFAFSPDDRFAYTVPWLSGLADFQREGNGTLRQLSNGGPGVASPPSPPSPDDGICVPGNMAVSGTGYIVLSWWGSEYGCNNDGYLLGTYTENPDGTLALVTSVGLMPAVYENSMAFDPTGAYLALAGTASCQSKGGCGAVQIYKLESDGTLATLGPAQLVPGNSFASVLWDNAGHVHVLTGCCSGAGGNPAGQGLYVYNFDGRI
ncbi:MAG: hypothetical protein ACLPND_02715 [Candidatus Korobacteraceae bacterium]|jgi:hypothetical protein